MTPFSSSGLHRFRTCLTVIGMSEAGDPLKDQFCQTSTSQWLDEVSLLKDRKEQTQTPWGGLCCDPYLYLAETPE